ncbi:MAG: patatin-like phospholipase family protein [Mariprofundaceae bacterium]|nr:patatin-like phospholipase family protein [Mariprofundaceae bacterium]
MNRVKDRGLVLALGGGGARGLAHIGVIEVLVREKIPIRAIVGTSIGAEIGAFFAAGISSKKMRELACRMDWISTMRLFTPDFSDLGVSTGKGIREYLTPYMADKQIEDLPTPFAAIATDLSTGEQVVIRKGNLLDAVRASISYPGLLTPFQKDGRTLIDGGMVNPVPFDSARTLFGGPVLAVQVHPKVELHVAHREKEAPEWDNRLKELLADAWPNMPPHLIKWFKGFKRKRLFPFHKESSLGVSSIMNQSQLIIQDMIMRLRMHISPPDLLLKPDISEIGSLEFYRAEDAILAGKAAVEAQLETIFQLHTTFI